MRWCPSARNAAGAELVGVFGPDDDRVTWLDEPVPVDDAAREWLAGRGGESRFRLAAPCVTARCAQWERGRQAMPLDVAGGASEAVEPRGCGGRCAVGAGLAALADGRTPAALPACGIRTRCRWWAEQGAVACRLCPLVRTDPVPTP